MANNANPQAVLFANTKIRPVNDLALSLYYSIQLFQQEWTQQSIAAVIPNDSNLIVDGSATDGRPPMTDAQAQIVQANLQTIMNVFTANSNLILNQLLSVAVHPASII